MIVDPNKPKSLQQEHVLVEPSGIVLHDSRRTTAEQLASGRSPFHDFCRSLDPNLCFIAALVPDDGARDLFFAAREQAQESGIHMQGTIEESSRQRRTWESYCVAKRNATPEATPPEREPESEPAPPPGQPPPGPDTEPGGKIGI